MKLWWSVHENFMDQAREKLTHHFHSHSTELNDMATPPCKDHLVNLVSSWVVLVQLSYDVRKWIVDIVGNYQSSPHRERGNVLPF